MNEEQVLNALACLTNGALNYYQTPQTILVRDELIRNYITNLQKQNTELKDNWNKLKEWLEEYIENIKMQYQNSEPIRQYSLQVIIDTLQVTIDKMQEIEGEMNE